MVRARLSSLRSRMLALWLVILAAALVLRLYATAEEQSLEAARAKGDVLRLAQHAAQDQARAVEGARQLLYVLAQERWLLAEDPTACGAFLARIREINPVYENLGIVGADGNYHCSAIPIGQPAAAAGRIWLQQASETRSFVGNDIQVGRVDGRSVVTLARPVVGDSLAPPAVVVAFIDLAALSRLGAKTQLPEGAALSVVDAEGRVLAHFPDHEAWVGKTYPDAPAVGALTGEGEGVAELDGVDGVRRLYAFTRVQGTAGWNLSVGISSEAVSADANANLRRNLVVLGLISLVVLAVIRLGGDALVFTPVERLVEATKRLREGNLNTRLGPPHPSGELGQLTRAFDAMAAALQAQQAKTKGVQQELQETSVLLEKTFASIGDAVLVAEAATVTFIACNPAVERIFGYGREELIGRTPEVLHLSPQMYEQFISLALPALRAEGMFRTEYPMRHKDGRILTCEHSLAVVRSASNGWLAVVNVIRDVTQRKRVEAALRQQAERLAALHGLDRAILAARSPQEIAEAALAHIRQLVPCQRASVLVFDPAGGALVLAVEAEGETSVGPGTRLAEGFFAIPEELASDETYLVEDILSLPRRSPLMEVLRAEGLRSFCSVPLLVDEGLIGCLNLSRSAPAAFCAGEAEIAREMGASLAIAIKQARLYEQVRLGRERLAALARQLLQAQEEERRRIARELHDEVGQALTGLGLALNRLSRPAAGGASPNLEEAQTLVGKLLAQVRELALDLRPAVLDSLGLLHALLWHCEKYENQTGVRVDLSHSGLEGRRFAAEVETATYRIVQEALTNVARHAQAKEAIVRVQADQETVCLAVEDPGVGFDPEAALASGHSSGLGGMQERANSLGGRLTIESAPHLGTCVRAEFPLRARSSPPPQGGIRVVNHVCASQQ